MGIRDLVKVANRLDNLGLNSEADALDRIIRKIAEEPQAMVAPVGPGPKSQRPSSVMSEEAFRAKYSMIGEDSPKNLDTLITIGQEFTKKFQELNNEESESEFNRIFQRLWRNDYFRTPEIKQTWVDYFNSSGLKYSDVGADLASLAWGKKVYNQTTGLNSTQPTGMKLSRVADYVVSRLSDEQKQNDSAFYNAFTDAWARLPSEQRLGFDQSKWTDLGPDMANKTWERIKPNAPSAPKPAPKRPMTDEQKWAAYAKRVSGGGVVQSMWVTTEAGKALTGDVSFESFRSWLPTMMKATGITNISATQLAGKLSDFKAAAYADKANGKTPGAPNTVLAALYANFNNQPEYARIVSSLGANKRIFDEPARLRQEKADRAEKAGEMWGTGPDLDS